MESHLEIDFGFSSSPAYPQAVRLAEALPGYTTSGSGYERCHHLTISLPPPSAVWESLTALLQRISSWRSTSLRLNGRPVSYWQIGSQVHQVQACHARRQE